MQHARIDNWSRGSSPLHRLHPAAKAVASLVLLVCISSLTRLAWAPCAIYLAVLVAGTMVAKLPVRGLLAGAAVVLPFALGFAAISLFMGQPERAALLVVRGYLSSLTALVLVASTPLPQLLAGFGKLGAPPFLLQVMQFLYRYLMVLAEEAGAMRDAAASRAGSIRVLEFNKAAAAAGVLFARSHARAGAIHRAMVARGFDGRMPVIRNIPLRPADFAFVLVLAATVLSVRLVLA